MSKPGTNQRVTAQPGNIFVLTEKGYNYRKQRGIDDIKTGQSFSEYKTTVPKLWIERGWVEEVKDAERN